MKKLLIAALSLFLLVGCSSLSSLINPTSSHGCADVFMTQIATTKTVQGSFECLAPSVQNQAHAYAISNDATLAANIGLDDVAVTYVGYVKDGYVYVVDGKNLSGPVTYIIHLNSNGKVDAIY